MRHGILVPFRLAFGSLGIAHSVAARVVLILRRIAVPGRRQGFLVDRIFRLDAPRVRGGGAGVARFFGTVGLVTRLRLIARFGLPSWPRAAACHRFTTLRLAIAPRTPPPAASAAPPTPPRLVAALRRRMARPGLAAGFRRRAIVAEPFEGRFSVAAGMLRLAAIRRFVAMLACGAARR